VNEACDNKHKKLTIYTRRLKIIVKLTRDLRLSAFVFYESVKFENVNVMRERKIKRMKPSE
jgi:hypothetical protein